MSTNLSLENLESLNSDECAYGDNDESSFRKSYSLGNIDPAAAAVAIGIGAAFIVGVGIVGYCKTKMESYKKGFNDASNDYAKKFDEQERKFELEKNNLSQYCSQKDEIISELISKVDPESEKKQLYQKIVNFIDCTRMNKYQDEIV